MTILEVIEDLKAKLKACPIEGKVYDFARAKKHKDDAGGFDISASDAYGTYHVAEFSEGGNYEDGTYWSNAEKNRQAFIAAFNAAPVILESMKNWEALSRQLDERNKKLAKQFVDMDSYAKFLEKKYNHNGTK